MQQREICWFLQILLLQMAAAALSQIRDRRIWSRVVRRRCRRSFRSDAALEALAKASEAKSPNVVALYNYPSFSGAFSALFAHVYHSRLNIPCLILPFSSVLPFRVEDVCIEGLKECYFLDFLGPKGFAVELFKRTSCKIIGFDHRKSVLSKIPHKEDLNENLALYVNLEKSSSFAVYEYFSSKLSEMVSHDEDAVWILDPKERERMEIVLNYIQDGDLRRWSLPDSRAFNIGIQEFRSKLNCITNPRMYEQLLEMSPVDIIAGGNSCLFTRQIAANKLLNKVFKVRLGRGFYGECLNLVHYLHQSQLVNIHSHTRIVNSGVRIDVSSDLSDEIGKELSRRSAAAGLRPVGAVIYMQRNNLKMCLRSMDVGTDTSEVAKAYGGGGSPSSSSFIIRMDEYNKWIS